MTNWNKYRRHDQSIDLLKAYHALEVDEGLSSADRITLGRYFDTIEKIQPIRSRQAAAIAIAQGRWLIGIKTELSCMKP